MDPERLFPLLALVFAGMAVLAFVRRRSWRGAAWTWALIAMVFAAVSWWLRSQGSRAGRGLIGRPIATPRDRARTVEPHAHIVMRAFLAYRVR